MSIIQVNINTETLSAIIAFSVVSASIGSFLILLFLVFRKRRIQHRFEIMEMKHQFSQTLLTSQIEIQEQTLRNISQELHDNISQKLGLAKLQLNQIQSLQPDVAIGPTKSVITEAIADIRSLTKSMHPDRIATIPLNESIEYEINLLRNATPVSFLCNIEADPAAITADQKIILFRIFQELLNNALKYAHATQINILFETKDRMTLSVADNGIGLPVEYQKGIGHTSIINRATLLKGTFHLVSNPGNGTVAKVLIPIR